MRTKFRFLVAGVVIATLTFIGSCTILPMYVMAPYNEVINEAISHENQMNYDPYRITGDYSLKSSLRPGDPVVVESDKRATQGFLIMGTLFGASGLLFVSASVAAWRAGHCKRH